MKRPLVYVLAALLLGSVLFALAQTRLPDGPGKALIEQKCQSCHGLDPIVGNKLTENEWNQIVGQMISFGAQVSPEERRTIVAYLVANFGPAGATSTPPSTSASADQGAQVYQANCAGCHQAAGTGIQGAFPPLARHIPIVLRANGGREYLALVMLNGLQGQIQVSGQAYNGVMPSYPALSDAQIAGVLNYISTQWGNSSTLPANHRPYTTEEIAALRAKRLTPVQMLAERNKLSLP